MQIKRSFLIGSALVLLAVLATVAPPSATAAPDDVVAEPIARGAVVEPGVRDAVADAEQATASSASEDGGVHVVVVLTQPLAPLTDVDALAAGTQRTQSDVLASLPRGGFEVGTRLGVVPAMTLRLRTTDSLDALAAHPDVVRVGFDEGGTGDLQHAVPHVGGDVTHSYGITGEGVRVAILDSGIDTNHPDLADDLVHQECFGFRPAPLGGPFCPNGQDRQSGAGAAEDDAGHGTHVSGIVSSKGVVSSVGMAPDAEIVSLKGLTGDGGCGFSGCFFSFVENVVAPLDWILQNNGTWGIDVINASVGTTQLFPGNCDSADANTMAGATAVNMLRANGVVMMASAGNDFAQDMTAPACLSNVISVGAADNLDVAAGFSNASDTTDVFAPGVNVESDAIGGGTTTASGTSMASPITAGCAALLIDSGEAVTPSNIEARLESSTVQISKFGRSYPRIQCELGPPCDTGFSDVLADHPFCAEIAWLVAQGITEGFPNGTFGAALSISRQAIAAFLFRYVDPPGFVPPGTARFPDVPVGSTFFEEIEWLSSAGITGGFSDGTFRPGASVTRQAMAAFLYRLAGEPPFTPPLTPTFPDVPVGSSFFHEIEWLSTTGITGGFDDGTFRPASPVTRQAMAAFLFRFDHN
jgi:subtilisin family serine protease